MTRNEGNQGDGVHEIIRSQPSRGLSFVRFCNATPRRVEVIWMNYEGARVKYKTLDPDEFFDVNTYVAHPWLFQDAITHERLNANSKHVFEPKPWYEQYLPDLRSGRIHPQDIQPKRVTVNITSPLYSLKVTAMHTIRRNLKDYNHVCQLEIPRQLQQDLVELMKSCRMEKLVVEV
ncbi:von Hippel-Lindau disease tumor suppressor-like [Daphnia carinata]|uniref:von Hippel-Lindau disease tumor suppressor-like n=1 Tax=Daphnia carinata TaxID=120202 RepID=UPI00257C974F|nr:von Hippel-Lindau disease tumor suppressor-like [Daphnia carinata]